MTSDSIYDFLVDTQRDYDRNHFTFWCYNLFELNERLHLDMSLSNRLYENNNGYLLRSYFVAFWEIIYNGKLYLERQKDKDEKHLAVIIKLIDEILNNCSDDDYFMINMYRNSASHIFLTRYSVLDKNDNPKEEECMTKFYKKSGEPYYLTYNGILEKAEKVFGGKHGVGLEQKYKGRLVNRVYPIIHKYCMEIGAINKANDAAFYEEFFPELKRMGMLM